MKNIIKANLLFVIMSCLIFAGCATTKTTSSKYVGNWNYIVKNLPDGDIKGIMTLNQSGDELTGDLKSEDGSISIKMEDLKLEGNQLSSNFYFQGMKIYLDGEFTGNDFDGKISVDYNEFPMTAKKIE